MPPALPLGLKRVTIAALVLSGLLGVGAAQGLGLLFDPPSEAQLDEAAKPVLGMLKQGQPFHDANKAMQLARLGAWQSIAGSRTAILAGLWATSALVFVAALHLLRPRGPTRDAVRKVLATTTLVSAVLRTLDGAQLAAIERRAGAAFDKVLEGAHLPGGWPEGLLAYLSTCSSMLGSLLVGGGLLMMSRYFRSEKVATVTRELDASTPEA